MIKPHPSSVPDITSENPGTTCQEFPAYCITCDITAESEQRNHGGNRKKLRRVVRDFVSTTTLHGVNHMGPKCGPKLKKVWGTAVVLCSIVLSIHTSFLIHNAVTRPPYKTTLTLRYKDFEKPDNIHLPEYPGITICGLAPVKLTGNSSPMSMAVYLSLSLGFPFTALNLQNRSLLFDAIMNHAVEDENLTEYKNTLANLSLEFEILKKRPSFNLVDAIVNISYSCEDVFAICVRGVMRIPCCDLFQPVLTNMGLCYTLNSTLASKDIFSDFMMNTHPLYIDLRLPNNSHQDSEKGFQMVIHDPRYVPRIIFSRDGLLISPEFVVSSRLELRVTDYSAIYTSWFGLVSQCPDEINPGAFNHHVCAYWHAVNRIRTVCGCFWVIFAWNKEEVDGAICGPREMTECLFRRAGDIVGNSDHCRMPCLHYNYEPSTSFAKLDYHAPHGERRSRITLSYSGNSFYHNVYHRHYFSALLSDVGGSMGLLLGASCITGLEVITFVAQYVYFRFLAKSV